ncbi:hypothetical protein HY024_00690 [Candidatus Curtissbacteria bacterium]|nr:hypothetical protein [Candidatus Curtissbacteria bacterium]
MPEKTAEKPASSINKMSPERSTPDNRGFMRSKLNAVKTIAETTGQAAAYINMAVNKTNPTWEATKAGPIPLPHAQGAVELFARKHPENQEVALAVKELLWEFYQEELNNSAMYKTEDGQASLPYTSINVTDLARKLYNAYGANPKPEQKTETQPKAEEATDESQANPRKPRIHTYFTFGSFLNPKGDAQFTFPEYAMHEYMKKLPAVLRQLENGEVPDNFVLYTVGYPTSMFGEISKEGVDEIEKDPYGKSAEWYEDFVKSHLEPNTGRVHFWGESMGGHFATATAEKLIDEKILTQNATNCRTQKNPEGVPYLTIIVDAPEMHEKWTGFKRSIRTNLGFALDGAMALSSRPDMRKWFSQNDFLASIALQLKSKGFEIHMSGDHPARGKGFLTKIAYELSMGKLRALGEKIGIGKTDPDSDVTLKKRALKALTDTIRDGWDYDHDKIKVERRAGTQDHTLDLSEFSQLARKKEEEVAKRKKQKYPAFGEPDYIPVAQREKQPNGLGAQMVKRIGKTRIYAIDMTHMMPKFNKNELKRYKHTADVYLNLKQYKSTKTPYLIAEAAGKTGSSH